MSNQPNFTRRRFMKAAGGIALVSGISAPAILRAQTAEAIRIGHLTPRTGFLGPLGEYGVIHRKIGMNQARECANRRQVGFGHRAPPGGICDHCGHVAWNGGCHTLTGAIPSW